MPKGSPPLLTWTQPTWILRNELRGGGTFLKSLLASLLKAADVVAELGKEYVLIKIILSAQHVLKCICTEQR